MLKAIAFAPCIVIAGCGYSEKFGDFVYSCHPGWVVDGPSCEVYLTDRYLLRRGEGSGDYVVLALGFEKGEGSAGLIDRLEGDYVRCVALDDQILIAKTDDGRFFSAPVEFDGYPQVIGPLTDNELAVQVLHAPPWKHVQGRRCDL